MTSVAAYLADLHAAKTPSATGQTPTATGTPPAGIPHVPNFPFMAYGAHNLPETWPCGSIHWRLVEADAPAGAEDLARQAFADITAVSGLEFTEDEPVAKLPSQFADIGYHGIVVAWAPKARFEAETTGPDAIGVGGPTSGTTGHYEEGTAWLLADWPGNQRLDFGSADAGHVLLHELGHALGLDHVTNDTNAVMTPAAGESSDGGTHWSSAERKALRYLRAACAIAP